jgi:hypothetical protein
MAIEPPLASEARGHRKSLLFFAHYLEKGKIPIKSERMIRPSYTDSNKNKAAKNSFGEL